MGPDAETANLRKIFPVPDDAAELAPRAAYAELDFQQQTPPGRPYTVVNMVATADGQGRIGKNTAKLGDAADAALFATLRERVDCVMAGASTIRIEGYNAAARGEEVQRRRSAAGLAARPLMATITRSGNVPVEAPLFSDPGQRVAVFGAADFDPQSVAADVTCPPETDPVDVVRVLREDHDVRSLLLEGGPMLNTPFFAAGLVDELFLTVAPALAGGEPSFPIIGGALPELVDLTLVSVLAGNDHLFLRYRVAG